MYLHVVWMNMEQGRSDSVTAWQCIGYWTRNPGLNSQFKTKLSFSQNPLWFRVSAINKSQPSIELPSLWGTWVQAESLLIKHWVKDSVGQFLRHSWQLFRHKEKLLGTHV